MPSDRVLKAVNLVHRGLIRATGGRLGGRARNMPAPDERARLWAAVTALHPHYAGYQRKTEREIPLVVLAPA